MAPRVSQQTRAILNTINQLQRLQTAMRKRQGANSSASALKMRGVSYKVADLITALDDVAGRMVGASGASVSETKERLKTESEKRRSGQLGAETPCEVNKADGPDLAGCMIALYPSKEIAQHIKAPGGESAKRIHMTVVFFEDAAADRKDWDKAAAIMTELATHMPVPYGTLTGTGRFEQPDGDVAYATIDLPNFEMWRDVLVEQLELAGFPVSKKYSYKPHLTLAYQKSDKPFPDTPLRVESIPVDFPEVHMVQGEKRIASAPFGSRP